MCVTKAESKSHSCWLFRNPKPHGNPLNKEQSDVMMVCTKPIFILIVLSIMAGCSDGRPLRVPVSGRVMIDGKPVEYGFVQILPENDRPAIGKLGPGGKFVLGTFEDDDGCVLGNHKVTVIANESEGFAGKAQRWHAPKKYINPASSNLRVEITKATNDLLIELTWEGGKPFVENFGTE